MVLSSMNIITINMKHKHLSLYVLTLIICSSFCIVSTNGKENGIKANENFITFQDFADGYVDTNGDGIKDDFKNYSVGDIIIIQDRIMNMSSGPSKLYETIKFENSPGSYTDWEDGDLYAYYKDVCYNFSVGDNVFITLHVLEDGKLEYCEEIEFNYEHNLYYLKNASALKHAPPIVVLNTPNGSEDWTGNSNHTIIYNVSGGVAPYTVKLYYTTDDCASFTFVDYHNQTMKGTYSYPWTDTPLITNETVKIMVNVTDNASETGFDTSENFTIDSTPPKIIFTSPANNSSTPLGSAIMIMFDEPMDNASVESAFSITPDIKGWRWEWISENNVMGIHDEAFEHNKHYTCTVNISAKDDSDPGNSMISNYSWSFTAQPGIGDFNVTADYPKNVEINKEYQVVVKIKNSEYAENRSGALFIRFYKRSENETFTQIGDAQFVGGMLSGENATRYSLIFSFESTGKNYVKVNITSTNPPDNFENKSQYYEVTYTVNVYPAPVETEEEIIPWEQLENIRILVIVIMVFLIIIFGYLIHIHRLQGRKKEKGIYADFGTLKKLSYTVRKEK